MSSRESSEANLVGSKEHYCVRPLYPHWMDEAMLRSDLKPG